MKEGLKASHMKEHIKDSTCRKGNRNFAYEK